MWMKKYKYVNFAIIICKGAINSRIHVTINSSKKFYPLS